MTNRVLVDTSVWIEYFRGRDTPETNALDNLLVEDRADLCGPVLTEIIRGVRAGREWELTLAMIHGLEYVECTLDDWLDAGWELNELQRRGITVPLADALIARLAIKSGCELLAVDKHFDHFKAVRRFKRKGRARR
ncbi:MAG: PIN domain-containing protein [Deltaproteobacteria bacterium]|nr:PIN domain-containing protein [Deltaproteobacteria bacterium]